MGEKRGDETSRTVKPNIYLSMYIVKYSGGSVDDYYTANIFVTHDKSKAEEYVKRYNEILSKWREYYKKYEENSGTSHAWIKDEFVNEYFDRWYQLNNVDHCYWEEIELR